MLSVEAVGPASLDNNGKPQAELGFPVWSLGDSNP